MAEEIDIARLNFDSDALDKALVDSRKEMDSLAESIRNSRKEIRDSNKEVSRLTAKNLDLAESGKENSKGYKANSKELERLNDVIDESTKSVVKNEKVQKELRVEQRELDKVIKLVNNTRAQSVDYIEKVDQVLKQEVNTIKEARDQNKQLNTLRNNINVNTEEGAEAIELLNKKLDENNNFVNENADGLTKQKQNIGNYNGELVKTGDQLGITNTFLGRNIASFAQQKGAVEGGTTAMSAFGGMITPVIKGIRAITVASLQFIATPIGALLTVLVIAFTAVRSAMSQVEESTNKLNAAFAPFKGILNVIINTLNALGGMIIDNIVVALDTLTKGFDSAVAGISRALKFLGFDEAAQSVDDWKGSLDEAAEMGREYEAMQQRLIKLTRENTVATAKETNELERNREIRDDTNATIAERIKAGEEVSKIIEKQMDRETELAQIQLESIELAIKQGDDGAAAKDQLAEATARLIDIESKAVVTRRRDGRRMRRVEGEQDKEREQAHKNRLDNIIEERQIALENFDLQNKGLQGSLEEEVQFYREQSAKKLEILKAQLNAQKISQQQYALEVQKIAIEQEQNETESAVYYINQRLALERDALSQRLQDVKRLDAKEVESQQEKLTEIYNAELESLEKQRDAKLISIKEFNELTTELEAEDRENKAELDRQFEEQKAEDEKLKKLLDHEQKIQDEENEFERQLERMEFEFEEKQNVLEEQRDEGLISEENYLQSLEILNKNYAKSKEELDQAVMDNQLQIYKTVLGQVSELLGESTTAGKFFAAAQTLITTFQSAQEGFYQGMKQGGLPVALTYAGLATAIGLKNVGKINKTKTQMYTGGYTGDGGVFTRTGYTHAGEVVFNQEDVRNLGGAERVNRMRPTASGFGEMPTGIPDQFDDNDKWSEIGNILKLGVQQGAQLGTNTGIIDYSDNINVKQKAIF